MIARVYLKYEHMIHARSTPAVRVDANEKYMNNYERTIMYKIVCKDTALQAVYVGHTTEFKKRCVNHRSRCYNPNEKCYNIRLYRYIRENGGFDNFNIVIIEQCSFNNKKEAIAHEGYLVNILDASLNDRMPGRTSKEWYEQNREHVLSNAKNTEQRRQRMSQPFECPICKSWMLWAGQSRHNKSNKHKQVEMAMMAGL